MIKQKKSVVVGMVLIAILVGLVVTNSCNVGLGESVDTTSPNLAITYPPVDSIIRDEFVLSGTCSDDKGLASVKVTVTNTDTSKDYGTYTATIDEDAGTWSIYLNQSAGFDDWGRNTWTFPDGNYSVDIIAYDKADRSSGTSSRTFTVDNTAPVFILSSPSSIDRDSPTKYGKTFKVEGTIADDNTVKTMNVTVYDDANSEYNFSESNIETAGGTSVTIAEYDDDPTTTENENYAEIYDSVSEGTQTFSCSVELIDSAKQYTNSDDDSETGNATSICFLYDDIYDDIMSSSKGLGLEASEIKNIINGTYTGSVDSDDVLDILYGSSSDETSTGIETDTTVNNTYFSLNPAASPTFNVIGFSIDSDDYESANSASSSTVLSVQTISGEDGTLFDPSTLTVYVFGPYDSVPDELDDLYDNPEDYEESDDCLLYESNSDYSGSSDDNYVYSVSFESGVVIESDKYYFIVETGEDKDGVEVEPSADYYGFIGTVSGNPPTITVSSPTDLSIVDSGAQTFNGTVSTDTGEISSIAYSIAVTDESGSDTSYTITGTSMPETTSLDDTFNWSFNVSEGDGYAEVSDGEQYLYTATITAKDVNGNSSEATSRVHVDTTDPVVKISSVTPTVTRTSDSEVCVNGDVTVSGKITESNLDSVILTVSDGTTSNDYNLRAVYSFDQTIDTSEYTDGATLTFTLSATDEGGNTNSTETTTTNIPELSYIIDQSTDNPVISLSNADTSITDSSTITSSTGNLFGTVSNNKILGTISDDDGLSSIVIGYRLSGSSDEYTTTSYSPDGTTTYSLSYTLPSDEDEYEIQITVTDTVGSSAIYNTTTSTFVVAVDSGAPVFSNMTPANGGYYSETMPVTGTITDGSGSVSLVGSGDGTSASYASSANILSSETETSINWTDTITVPEDSNTYEIIYTATDKYGQESSYAVSYVVDKDSPTITLDTLGGEDISDENIYLKQENIYTFAGTVKDNTGGSGIDSVSYALNEETYSATVSGTDWSASVALSSLDEGEYTISFTATDSAGNTTTTAAQTFYIDATAPTSTIMADDTAATTDSGLYTSTGTAISDDDASTDIVFGTSYLAKAKFTLQGTITETYIDTATLTITKDGTSVDGVTFTSGGDSSGTAVAGEWTYVQATNSDGSDDGLYVYTIAITDLAGREYEKTISVRVDTTAPTLEVTQPTAGEATAGTTSGTNTVYTLKGIVDDDGCGVSSVNYEITNGGSIISSGTATITGASWKATDVSLGSSEGTLVLTTSATDLLGNKMADSEITFYYDKASPTLTETGINTSGLTTNGSFTLSGTASDTNELSSVVITDSVNGNTWTATVDDDDTWSQIIYPTATTETIPDDATTLVDGTYSFTIIATDIAERTTTLTRTVVVDTEKPEFVTSADTDNPAFANPTYTNSDDDSVTYYYNSTQISVIAIVSDDTSGISSVEYTTSYGIDDESWVSLTKKSTDDDGYQTWKGNISCTEGSNSIVIKVTDVAGNEKTTTSYLAYADTTDPECDLSTVDGEDSVSTKLVNGNSDITVTGTVSDSGDYPSGVASVSLSLGGTVVGTDSDTTGTTWSIIIPSTSLVSGTVKATATDNVGNTSASTSLFSIQLDSTPPIVKISSPSSSSDINGTSDFSGTVTENNPLSIALYYYVLGDSETNPPTSLDDGWTLYKKITTATGTDTTEIEYGASVSEIYNWNITDFDFETLANNGSATVYILPVAYDQAGNSSVEDSIAEYGSSSVYTGYYTYSVDQDSDRPVIKFTNLDLEDMTLSNYVWLKQNDTLYGTITDDDGISSLSIMYKYDDTDFTSVDVSVSSGSWNYELPEGDGSYSLIFIVTDTEGTTFTCSDSVSTTSDLLATPKITDGTNTFGYDLASADTVIYLTQDTNDPEIEISGLSKDDGATWKTSSYSSLTLGGSTHVTDDVSVSSTKTFELKCTASDANGIDSVTLTTSGLSDSDGNEISASYTGVGMTSDGDVATDDSLITYYLFSDVDCSSGSGTMAIKVTAIDEATNSSVDSISVSVDNTAATVSVISPSSETTSSGSVTAYGTINETPESVYYAVSVSGTQSPDDSSTLSEWEDSDGDATDLSDSGSGYVDYEEISDASFSWYVYFDGDTDTSLTTTHASLLNDYLVSLGITTEEKLDNNNFTDVVKLYIWIKAVDKAGNITETPHLVLLDPQGGRPTVTIAYPDENGVSLGGSVRLYGSATDDSSVRAVFVQFVSTQHNLDSYSERSSASYSSISADSESVSTLTESDIDYMAAIGTVYEISTYGTSSQTTWTAGDSPADFDGTDWGLRSSFSGSSWSLELNDSDELNPTTGTTNAVGFRVYATDYDDTPTKSVAVDRVVSFDADNPVISDVYLIQSSDASYLTESTSSVEYTDDMWVKDEWYIKGTITDADEIKTLKINGDTLISSTSEVSNSDWDVEISDDKQTVYFKYKLDTDSGIGTLEFTISATDNASSTVHTTDKAISINYDNTPPTLKVSGDDYQIDPIVSQSNNFYTFGAQATESATGGNQSGFARAVVYFLRRDLTGTDTTFTVFDPMISTDTSGNTIDIASAIDEDSVTDSTADGTIVYKSGLYWKYQSLTRDEDNLSSLTISTTDDNIHVGGLVEIGNAFYTIESVDDDSITIDGSPEVSYKTAYFAMALVVDNTITESSSGSISTDSGYGYGYYSSPLNDDGDLMIEGVSKSGTTWTWEANICSKNIPDGPIEIHYVVYDEAGNYSIGTSGNVESDTYGTYDTLEVADSNNSYYVYDDYNSTYTEDTAAFVSNNAPRIAGVQVGTDLDNDNAIGDSEWDTTYAASEISSDYLKNGVYDPDDLGTSIELGDDTNALLTTKGYTEINPEIVGGNGDIYYSYSYSNGDSAVISGDNSTSLGSGTSDYTEDSLSTIKLQIGDLLKAGTTDATLGSSDNVPFTFKIWDSTAATTTFTNSQYATIVLHMSVDLKDENPPTASIMPFYWTSNSDNSLYDNSSDNGHIELETDWKNSDGYDASTSGEYDDDPKVSGQVTITGSAFDANLLSALYVSIPNMSLSNIELTSSDTTNIPSEKTINSVTYYLVATCTDTVWTGVAELEDYGFKFEIDSNTYTSDGNTVNWTLSWDTSKISTVAATDVAVQVLAVDQGIPSVATTTSSSYLSVDGLTYYDDPTYSSLNNSGYSTTQTTSDDETSLYTVDVVPYITSIETSDRTNSGLKDNNIRSASGKYSILKDTTDDFITVYGFNLDDSDVYITNSTDVLTEALTDAGIDATATSNSEISFSNNISNSGYLDVYTNGIRTLNNINDNSAVGSYAITGTDSTDYQQMYNREPDMYETKNIQLTDDRYLRMFDMKDTEIQNGYYPTMIMDGNNPVFGYVDLNGINTSIDDLTTYQDQCYQPQRAEFDATTGTTSDIEYLIGGLTWSQMAMAEDEDGKFYHATVYDYSGAHMSVIYDTYAEDHTWSSGTYTDGWGDGAAYTGYGGVYAYSTGNNAISLESVSYGNGTLIGRYQNPKLVVTGDSSTTTGASIYMAYYDDNTDDQNIIFRTFKIGQNTGWTNSLKDGYANLAERNTSGRQAAAEDASQYFDMGVTSGGVVVVVYYDQAAGMLKMVYSTDADSSTPTTASSWTTSSIDFPDYVGRYVSMTIDSDDTIHIAAYDANDGDLRYMQVSSYVATSLAVDCTVDQDGSVGNWTQIKLNNNIPYIAYYNATETGSHDAIKLAYANSSTITAGVDDNGYTTGSWEYMTVPSLTAAQGGSDKFKQVNLGFDDSDKPVVGYLGTDIEFGKWLDED
jgi:hypothetical protein